jgi:ABC-type transport system involved in multi-copper enzyme maturation permease subunit
VSAATAVIARELRTEARRPVNFWLRWLAAGVLIGVFGSLAFGPPIGLDELGAALFAAMQRMLLLAFWIIVPLMTADCVSRERREGTLGLLFLTPLTVLEVILAKATVHALRALTLFLAALPVLGLPFVLGGVSYGQALIALVQLANAILLGIAAGIFASTRGGSSIQVMVMAGLWAAGLAALSSPWVMALSAMPNPSGAGLVVGLVFSMMASGVLFGVMLRMSIKRLEDTWKEETAAPERPRWVEGWVDNVNRSELLQTIFRWDKGPTLDRNPMAWLQEYSWTARLTKWGWFLGLLLVQMIVISEGVHDSSQAYEWLACLLALGVAFSAAGSFRRENETGLLELLLVTPLSVRQIVNGRIWGVCCHYLPAIGILLVGLRGDYLLNPRAYSNGIGALVFPNPLTFLALMLVGLVLSLGRLNFFVAWLLTWFVAFLVPNLLTLVLQVFVNVPRSSAMFLVSTALTALVIWMWIHLQVSLRRRTFI